MSLKVFLVFIMIKSLMVSGQNHNPEQTFIIGKDEVNYTSAAERCKLMNASLVVINNQNIQNQLQEEIQKLPKRMYCYYINVLQIRYYAFNCVFRFCLLLIFVKIKNCF